MLELYLWAFFMTRFKEWYIYLRCSACFQSEEMRAKSRTHMTRTDALLSHLSQGLQPQRCYDKPHKLASNSSIALRVSQLLDVRRFAHEKIHNALPGLVDCLLSLHFFWALSLTNWRSRPEKLRPRSHDEIILFKSVNWSLSKDLFAWCLSLTSSTGRSGCSFPYLAVLSLLMILKQDDGRPRETKSSAQNSCSLNSLGHFFCSGWS